MTDETKVPEPHATVIVEYHDCPKHLFDTLARVFPPQRGSGTHEWLQLRVDDVFVNFHRGRVA